LLGRLLRLVPTPGRKSEEKRFESAERIAPALDHLGAHMSEPVRVQDLAALCHMSAPNLRRWFHRILAVSPHEYLTQLRTQMGAALLTGTDRPIVRIAGEIGYESLSSFNRHFRRQMGTTPREWRLGGERK
jgi:AraC family transcriptional regulator, activator of mtrCDE